MDAMTVFQAEQRPVGGAVNVGSLIAEELVGHPIEHTARMRAGILICPDPLRPAHHEDFPMPRTGSQAETTRPGQGNLIEAA